jgi:hypothetical protein
MPEAGHSWLPPSWPCFAYRFWDAVDPSGPFPESSDSVMGSRFDLGASNLKERATKYDLRAVFQTTEASNLLIRMVASDFRLEITISLSFKSY